MTTPSTLGTHVPTTASGTPSQAHMAAKAGAKKTLKKAPQACASGNCEAKANRTKYKTRDAAAKAALDNTNDRSIAENKEYGGLIYKNSDGTYSYTEPVPGTEDKLVYGTSDLPDGTSPDGDYHTHGAARVDTQLTEDGPHVTVNPADVGLPASADTVSNDFSGRGDFVGDIQRYEQQADRYPGYVGYLGTPSGAYKSYDPATGITRPLQ